MNWVKENYDRFLLAVAALVLAACAGILFNQARGFNDVFQSLKDQVPHSTKIPAVDTDGVKKEAGQISNPDAWKLRMVGDRSLPVFVSVPYISKTDPDGKEQLIDPLNDDVGQMIHPPVPNKWFIDNKQELLAQNALTQDTDSDGFTALDEFLGKTDPQDKDKHPPFITKLFMKQFVRVPFRLRFDARTGQTVQLNTLDIENAPTQFLQVGKMVEGTRYKIIKLDIKEKKIDGIMKDVSELTLQNVDTKVNVVLVKEQEIDSPTTYAVMTYLWNSNTPDFKLNKGGEFILKPEDKIRYRCTDLSADGATVVRSDTNQQIKVSPLPPPSK